MTALTQEQKEQARQAKAAKERERRAMIAAAKEAVETAGIFEKMDGSKIIVRDPADDGARTELSSEQRDRAATYKAGHGGLTGNALAAYILTGATARQQVCDAQQQRRREERSERQRSNVTRSQDPPATEIAQKAREFAGVKSSFLPKEGRGFLDAFTVEVREGKVAVRRGNAQGVEGALETAEFAKDQLVAFAKGHTLDSAEDQKAVRAALSGLGKGTVLWGRKLAALIAVRAEEA